MYRYDNYTDSFVRVDRAPNTGSTTVRIGVPLKEAVVVQKTELTDECIDRIADAVVRKLKADTLQTEKPKIRKRIIKPFRAVWLDDDHNEIGTPQTEREGE